MIDNTENIAAKEKNIADWGNELTHLTSHCERPQGAWQSRYRLPRR